MDLRIVFFPAPGPVLFSVDELGGEATITAGPGDTVSSITITGGIYAGTYTTNSDATALTTVTAGTGWVVNLVKPTIAGTTGVGDTLTATPGLWIYEGASPGEVSFQWQRGGVNITGEVDLTYVIVGADQGTDATIEETFGGITVESAATSIPSPTIATDAAAIYWFDPNNISFDGSNNVTSWPDSALGADGTYDLNTVPSDVSAPVWDAANSKVTFNGSQALRSGTDFPTSVQSVESGGEVLVVFAVIDALAAQTTRGRFWCESLNNGGNQSTGFGYNASNSSDITVNFNSNEFGNGAGNIFTNYATASTVPVGKMLFEYHLSQTYVRIYIDGVLEHEFTSVTLANYAASATVRLTLGGRASATTTEERCAVNIYELFATFSIANASVFRSELATRHGITI